MSKRRNPPSSSSSDANKKLEYSRVYERRRRKEEEKVDLISNLPNDILYHIFSFLDLKQIIQTCKLSTKWRYFWVSFPTLKFSYTQGKGCRNKTKRNEFMAFVDRVLMLRGNVTIPDFILITDPCIDVTDRLNTWILVCVIRNVRQLTLHTQFPETFHFHHCLFTCKSLTKLVVEEAQTCGHSSLACLSLPDLISLPSLKILSLDHIKFKKESIMKDIFASCPALESLIMKRCEFLNFKINISSRNLQHLVLRSCTQEIYSPSLDSVSKFKLWAPNLISFYCDDYLSARCAPTNLFALVKADIDVYVSSYWSKETKEMYAQNMVNILRELHYVKDLKLSVSFFENEVVTGFPYLLNSRPTKFHQLKCLKLMGNWHSMHCIDAISYLLKISPIIETLSIEECGKFENAATVLLEVQPTEFCNLRCLKMDALLSIDSIYVIAYFLKISPKLETLSFKVFYSNWEVYPYWDPDEVTYNSANRGDFWETGLSWEGLLNHLKCFELRDVTGRINELEFIEILLEYAKLLEKLLIVFKQTNATNKLLVKFSKKVLRFPKTSSSVEIKFIFSN